MADTRLSQLLDAKGEIERKIVAAINANNPSYARILKAQLADTLKQIDALTIDEARAQAQREFFG